jgi:hypothetical protein
MQGMLLQSGIDCKVMDWLESCGEACLTFSGRLLQKSSPDSCSFAAISYEQEDNHGLLFGSCCGERQLCETWKYARA